MAMNTGDQRSISKNMESWKYTAVNSMKIPHTINDAEAYIVGQCNIWSIGQRTIGEKFIHDLRQSIHRFYNSFVGGLEYIDETGDYCFLLVVVKPHFDMRQKKIALCHHKLSRSNIRSGGHDNVIIEESMASSWLKQRACDDLCLSSEQRGYLMSCFMDGSGTHVGKAVIFSWENGKILQDEEANNIIRESKWNSWNSGWRYYSVNRTESGFLSKIPEIFAYSKSYSNGESFLEHLSNDIKSLKNPTEFSYPLNFGEIPCTLSVVVIEKTRYRVEMAIRIQLSSVHSG
ncbi:unnamed protein product [Rotaria magnacalcarata]